MDSKIPRWLLGLAGALLLGAVWWWQASPDALPTDLPASLGGTPSTPGEADHVNGAPSQPRAPHPGSPSAQTLVQTLRVIETAKTPIAEFRAWATRYFQSADATEKAAILPEGERLAEAHRLALKEIIAADPRTALEQAVPMVVRQALPDAITNRLEARLSGVGAYDVLAVSPDSDPSEPTVRRFATLNGTEYRAHIYGRRDSQMSASQAMLNGIAVDREFAVNESPVRPLETGEVPDRGCP